MHVDAMGLLLDHLERKGLRTTSVPSGRSVVGTSGNAYGSAGRPATSVHASPVRSPVTTVSTARATSPGLSSGNLCLRMSRAVIPRKAVSVNPGQTALIRTPLGPNDVDSART